jgi:hypothetical protein
MKITFRVYRYAPEQSIFWVNGRVYAPMYSQLAHDLGCLVVEGRVKEAEDMIKRDIRKKNKESRRCTIGFFEKDTKRYFYTSQLVASDNDLQDKLRVYKEWKHFVESKNCVMGTHEISEGSFIPEQKSSAQKRMTEDIADLSRPIKIYLVA